MKPFHYYEPSTLEEALDLLDRYGDRARVLAGGTDLVVQMKQKKTVPEAVISLKRIPGLDGIEAGAAIRIGPLVSMTQVAAHPAFAGRLSLLRESALAVADIQIRNAATVGGNIANASPSADLSPSLLALGAKVTLRRKGGERVVGLDAFCVGPFCTRLEGSELITEVSISPVPGGGAYVWRPKKTTVDETLVGVAAWIRGDPANKTCVGAAVALGSVAPVPLRARKAEAFLQGKTLSLEIFRAAGEIAAEETSPRSRADYRRTLVAVLTEEALERAWRRAQ